MTSGIAALRQAAASYAGEMLSTAEGRRYRMAKPAQTSPNAEPISVATITNGALMVQPRPKPATTSRPISGPSRTTPPGTSAETTPPKARTAAQRIRTSAKMGTSAKPAKNVLRSSGDDAQALTTQLPT